MNSQQVHLTVPAFTPESQAPSLSQRLQMRCVQWGAYWRASDSHGVILTHEQALELLRDALGVEVEMRPETLQETILRLHAEGADADEIAADLWERADEMDAAGISIAAVLADTQALPNKKEG